MDNETLLVTFTGLLLSLGGILSIFAQTLYNGISIGMLFITAIFVFSGFSFLMVASVMDYINRKVVNDE